MTNFEGLQTMLYERGFDYLDPTRLGQYINRATNELVESETWHWRLVQGTGAVDTSTDPTLPGGFYTPGLINDLLGPMLHVSVRYGDEWINLKPRTFLDALEYTGDYFSGTPMFYAPYTSLGASGSEGFIVYPAPVDAMAVQFYHYQRQVLMVTDSTTTIVPVRYEGVLVDIAVRMAYRDADNHEAAEALQIEIDRELNRMRMAYVGQVGQPTEGVQTTERW